MEKIDLDLDDDNEITFNVQIEGTRPGEPMCRLMIENANFNFSIDGEFLENDEVSVTIPPMKSILREGTYDSHLEVIVDDRVFVPLELKINFEKSVKVVAESVTRKKRSRLKATATVVSAKSNKKSRQDESKTPKTPQVEKENVKRLSEHDIMNLVKELKRKAR